MRPYSSSLPVNATPSNGPGPGISTSPEGPPRRSTKKLLKISRATSENAKVMRK